MVRRLATAFACALLAAPPLAAQTLTVESVVSPAWVERGAVREPLAPGRVLENRDTVRTGAGARVLLRMAEGSAVKLGENATLGVDGLLEKKAAETRFVGAALDVVRGAFRFTTGVFAKQRAGRDVRIRIDAVTAGIRGTDVWGKSEPSRDIVCLIEGEVVVEHAGRQFTMQEPLSFFIAPRREQPQPVSPVSKAQLDLWSAETEIQAGSGASARGGRYAAEAVATRDHAAAEGARSKLRAAGFPAQVEIERDSYGGEEYRVKITGLTAVRDAESLAAKLRALGFADARAAR